MRYIFLFILLISCTDNSEQYRCMVRNRAHIRYMQSKCADHKGWSMSWPIAMKFECQDQTQFSYTLEDLKLYEDINYEQYHSGFIWYCTRND